MSTPLENFFARFASLGFHYRQRNTARHNFERLSQMSRWEKGSKELTVAEKGFKKALTQQFNFVHGTSTDLASWQKLCAFIGITPVPNNIKECQHRVEGAHVNIVDLLECKRTGKRVRRFETLEALRAYTRSTGKIFSRDDPDAGSLLRELLREIFNEYHGKGRSRPGGDKKKKERGRKQVAAAQSS